MKETHNATKNEKQLYNLLSYDDLSHRIKNILLKRSIMMNR